MSRLVDVPRRMPHKAALPYNVPGQRIGSIGALIPGDLVFSFAPHRLGVSRTSASTPETAAW